MCVVQEQQQNFMNHVTKKYQKTTRNPKENKQIVNCTKCTHQYTQIHNVFEERIRMETASIHTKLPSACMLEAIKTNAFFAPGQQRQHCCSSYLQVLKKQKKLNAFKTCHLKIIKIFRFARPLKSKTGTKIYLGL